MSEILKLKNVSKSYEGFKLDNINLTLDSGFIMRDGQVYFMQGSNHTRIVQVAHNKDLHRE